MQWFLCNLSFRSQAMEKYETNMDKSKYKLDPETISRVVSTDPIKFCEEYHNLDGSMKAYLGLKAIETAWKQKNSTNAEFNQLVEDVAGKINNAIMQEDEEILQNLVHDAYSVLKQSHPTTKDTDIKIQTVAMGLADIIFYLGSSKDEERIPGWSYALKIAHDQDPESFIKETIQSTLEEIQ